MTDDQVLAAVRELRVVQAQEKEIRARIAARKQDVAVAMEELEVATGRIWQLNESILYDREAV